MLGILAMVLSLVYLVLFIIVLIKQFRMPVWFTHLGIILRIGL